MERKLLLLILLCVGIVNAQNGNTINDAIVVDGVNTSVNLIDYDSATSSGLTPECIALEDVFYKHSVSTGDNSVVIGMTSAGTIVLSQFHYQIFKAPNGDINNMEELICSSYMVPVLANGSFELVVENILDTDVFYLRVYKPTGLGANLTALLSGTLITMHSQFNAVLSSPDNKKPDFSHITKNNRIELINNHSYDAYHIYGLDGKLLKHHKNNQVIDNIDISLLSSGIYIMNLVSENDAKAFKFAKN